jgi:hypothetical protein
MTPPGDGYLIDVAEEIVDLTGSFLDADRGSQCRAETHAAQLVWEGSLVGRGIYVRQRQ